MDKVRLCLLFGTAFFVCLIAMSSAGPVKDENFKEKVASCKELCGHCDCQGFYCGDECICECSDQSDEELNCVDTMQDNCEKLNLSFEVLLQGSTKNRIVRSLMYADPSAGMDICPNENVRNQRNTISIYKPAITENKVQKRDVRKYEEVSINDLNEAGADEAECLEKQAQHITSLTEQEAEDAIQLALAEHALIDNEDIDYNSNADDDDRKKTLEEVEKMLALLGIYVDNDDDSHTDMHVNKYHEKREISANEESIADAASSLQLPADSSLNKRHVEPFGLFNGLAESHKYIMPELLLTGGKAFLGVEKVKILLDELAEKGKLAASEIKFNLADLGIKKLAIADLGLKTLDIAELSKKLAIADIGKKFAEIDLAKLGLDNKLILDKLLIDKALGAKFKLDELKFPLDLALLGLPALEAVALPFEVGSAADIEVGAAAVE